MKIKLLTTTLIALLFLPSCDDNNSSSTNTGGGDGSGGGGQQGGETRSLINKRIRFVGTSVSTSTTNVAGSSIVTTTNTSTDVTDDLRSDGTSLSNGTATITSLSSSIGTIPGPFGQVTQVENEIGTYSFNLASNGQTATLISFEENNAEFVAILTYTSDTTGTYIQTSDQTINGVRLVSTETGTFEIIGSL